MKGTELTMEWGEEGDTQAGLIEDLGIEEVGPESWKPFNIKALSPK